MRKPIHVLLIMDSKGTEIQLEDEQSLLALNLYNRCRVGEDRIAKDSRPN